MTSLLGGGAESDILLLHLGGGDYQHLWTRFGPVRGDRHEIRDLEEELVNIIAVNLAVAEGEDIGIDAVPSTTAISSATFSMRATVVLSGLVAVRWLNTDVFMVTKWLIFGK